MPDGDERRQRGQCPACAQPLDYQGATQQAVPFWERIDAFFRYPLQTGPLQVLLPGILIPLLLPPTLWGLAGALLLLALYTRYGLCVIEDTAQGRLRPPALGQVFKGGLSILLQQLTVFGVFGLMLVSAVQLGGDLAGLVVLALVMLVLPACTMVLALTKTIVDAINPLKLLMLTAGIGWPYLRLCGYLFLLSLATAAVQQLVLVHFPPWLGWPAAGVLCGYFLLVFFNMSGYLLFQYQGKVILCGPEMTSTAVPVAAMPGNRSLRIDADIDIQLKEGNYEQVLSLLEDLLRKQPDNQLRREHLFRLLSVMHQVDKLRAHAEDFVRLLTQKNRAQELVDLLKTVQAHNPAFRLEEARLLLGVMELLYQKGEYALMFSLGQDAHKRFPGESQVADVYFLIARALANGLQRWDKALSYLQFIEHEFPAHPIQARMADYQQMINRRARLDPGHSG